MTVNAAGLKWDVAQMADNMGPSHEDSVEGNLLGLLKPGDVFLDVGSHVGHYALRAAGTASKVIAIEANPDTAAQLAVNLALNDIGNVTVHNIAAWDSYTRLALHSPNQLIRDGSMRVLPAEEAPVQGMPLDDLLGGEPQIDLVKLDVEGADLHALRGMRETLARCRPVMFIEDHSIYGYYQRADLDALIAELGYGQRDGGAYGCAAYLIAEPA